MDLIIRMQVYIVSFFVLLIIYIQLKEESQSYSLHDQLFRYLVLSATATLVFEAISWSVDGKPGTIAYIANMGSNTLLLMMNTIPLMMWMLYMIETVNRDKKLVLKYLIILGIPTSFNMLIALSTPFSHKYFFIDADNLYHRGGWAWFGIGIHGILFIASIFITIYNGRKINLRNRMPMLLFMVPPIIGFILQMMFYGTSFVWPGATISILMGYIMIQSQTIKIDYLTGLYNRRELDSYLDKKIRNLPRNKKFAGVMIDLDDFKTINDQHGHMVGDQAIKTAASLIRKSFKKDDFVARYGGDEFVVILDVKDDNEFIQKIENLHRQFELFNEKGEEGFQLKLSIGYDTYTHNTEKGSEFIHHLDRLMYEYKQTKK